MRGLVSKYLRKDALRELIGDGVPKRELISLKSGSQINSPHSIRRLYLDLKRAFKRQRAGMHAIWSYKVAQAQGLIKALKVRGHGKKKDSKAQPEDRIMLIQKPLEFILQHCPPSKKPNGDIELHPVYASARHAANRGRGDLVKRMAAQFVPA